VTAWISWMNTMVRQLSSSAVTRLRRDNQGASLVEYALLVALIAVVCVAAVAFFGGAVNNSFSKSGSSLP
jgi:pilus assembly protein Flp/PilA